MSKRDGWEKFSTQVGYTPEEAASPADDDPRVRLCSRLVPLAGKYSIVAEVVETANCASLYRAGDRFVLDLAGNFISKLCPKRICVYLAGQLMIPVALINERVSEGLDPNLIHFMRRVPCLDTGIKECGYGQTTVEVKVVPNP